MIPDRCLDALVPHLEGTVQSQEAVQGGCIANASRLVTTAERYFVKWSDGAAAQTFEAEAAGLEALAAADAPLVIPEVVAVQGPTSDAPGFLVLEWIPTESARSDVWERFGTGLAQLHRHATDQYGFGRDNFIGRLPQPNPWHTSWPAFFRAARLEPQVQRARDAGRWLAAWNDPLDRLYRRLPDLLPAEPPASVVHGDLWKGNFMITEKSTPVLIDPAAYYGHREVDLAMTELFGGFSAPFYAAYRSAWPLPSGYGRRKTVYNLYHLINHLNHFGSGYADAVGASLAEFA